MICAYLHKPLTIGVFNCLSSSPYPHSQLKTNKRSWNKYAVINPLSSRPYFRTKNSHMFTIFRIAVSMWLTESWWWQHFSPSEWFSFQWFIFGLHQTRVSECLSLFKWFRSSVIWQHYACGFRNFTGFTKWSMVYKSYFRNRRWVNWKVRENFHMFLLNLKSLILCFASSNILMLKMKW